MRRFILIALFLLAPLFAVTAAEKNVLFVGNSYTMAMARIFAEISKAGGQTGRHEQVTFGGVQLRQHLEKGNAVKLIESAHWDYVILQEQGQTPGLPVGQVKEMMDPAVEKLLAICKTNKAQPLLYCHWAREAGDKANYPDDTYEKSRDRMNATFTRLNREQGITLCQVSNAWDIVKTKHPAINLYAGDRHHPSAAGSYLAACLFYGQIFQVSPQNLPTVKGVDAEQAKILRDVAWEVAQKAKK